MTNDESTILGFWGKARATVPISVGWHAAAYHLIDVACSADFILRARPRLLQRGSRLLGVSIDETLALTVALASLHDLGKFAWRFQAKVPERYPDVLGTWRAPPAGASHAADGQLLWEKRLSELLSERLWPGSGPALGRLARAVFGHHGRPVSASRDVLREAFGDEGMNAALTCASRMVDLWLPSPIAAAPLTQAAGARASWWLSGVVTLADWVGSQEDHFRYEGAAHPLAGYHELAVERAGQAVRACGLATPRPAAPRDFATVTGITGAPSPAQAWASTVSLPDGPVLVLLEDVTGAGKTEAAQMLVHRLVADGRATGAYWAMPTQATANAMYERQRAMLDGLYDTSSDTRPSLVLAHGQARLSDRFRATVLRADRALGDVTSDAADAEPTSSTSCAAFIADDRRAALLADVGAGTIDQALLGVLPSRFCTLRLAGLGDKVLVLDEAHAYDSYMQEEIGALLRFQAALGGCAVVLSATLARRQWEGLVQSWQEGLGVRGGAIAQPSRERAYPLATVVASMGAEGEVRQVPLDADAQRSHREVHVEPVRSIEAAVAYVVATSQGGGAVAWIRNTVDECLAAAALLRAEGIEPLVFHARFAQGDRQRREREVLALFGRPDATRPERESERRGRVLVATQVVEQSLDLDFDAMVSDLAPVDLLIQRAGRLWRHSGRNAWREAQGLSRSFFVLTPETSETPAATWPAPLVPKVRYVYPHVGVLWRTACALEASRRIVTPGAPDEAGGLRALVGAVYDADDDEVPASLLEAADRAHGEQGAQAAAGRFAVLKVRDGYDASGAAWVDDLRAVTRLGAERTTVRLARVTQSGQLEPWEPDTSLPEWQRWALSEVKLSRHRVPAGTEAPLKYAVEVARLRGRWGRWEQDTTIVPIEKGDDGCWSGRGIAPNGSTVTLRVDPLEGLSFERRGGTGHGTEDGTVGGRRGIASPIKNSQDGRAH
ncbi:MAG: CRISPR-associated helicase Cas3' [Gemmatimonadaceae bacterium]|nr:CRISPR-associated helicase Cas3' [Gemmatimonadaceae bacterium]